MRPEQSDKKQKFANPQTTVIGRGNPAPTMETQNPNPYIILMSGVMDRELEARARGADRSLAKPFDIPKLIEAIEAWVGEEKTSGLQ